MAPEQDMIQETAKLFGSLWKPFDDKSFELSVGLFRKRFVANGFDMNWFKGKRCLDVGCGGGRYCIAMAREGAKEVIGVDVGVEGLEDARIRSKSYPQISYKEANVLDLPFQNPEFDFVFCSGVLHHTPDPERGFKELCRVLKPAGKIYLLIYATGGIRWPAVMDFRQCLKDISEVTLKKVMNDKGFPPSKIRTLVDDLKVSLIGFYTWEYVKRQLRINGISKLKRWTLGRLDHEENLDEMICDLNWFERCFKAGKDLEEHSESFDQAYQICHEYLSVMRYLRDQVNNRGLRRQAVERVIIGQGHHRLIGEKI